MAHFALSLKLEKRRERRLLIRFLDLTSLFLGAGFELGHAWKKSEAFLDSERALYRLEKLRASEKGMLQHLESLTQDGDFKEYQKWFLALFFLYQEGASMVEIVEGIATSLQIEERNDLEAHLRLLPTKLQVILILFFFPPAVLLLMAPLLLSLNSLL